MAQNIIMDPAGKSGTSAKRSDAHSRIGCRATGNLPGVGNVGI